MRCPMTQVDDLSCCLATLDENSTLVAVVEMSQSSWLTAGLVPGVDRRPLKKLAPDAPTLLHLLERWREEAKTPGRVITRIVLAYEAGRDRILLAPWLPAPGIEAYVRDFVYSVTALKPTNHPLQLAAPSYP